MPNLPTPFAMCDWKRIARDYDALVFDHAASGELLPLIWDDPTGEAPGFGLYTIPRHPMQGPNGHLEYHEAINCMAAVVGASLVGIDKRQQDGRDYVGMCLRYFWPRESGGGDLFTNIVAHFAGAYSPTRSMWYFLFPNMLASMLVDLYPSHGDLDDCVRRSADRIAGMVPALETGEWYKGFDFAAAEAVAGHPFVKGDATAGVAWIELMAWARFGDEEYLQSAMCMMDTLSRCQRSPFYEVLLPFGVTVAARMNAEHGTAYDVTRLLDWCLDGESACRPGRGVIADRWDEYDVHGLQGSITDGGGLRVRDEQLRAGVRAGTPTSV